MSTPHILSVKAYSAVTETSNMSLKVKSVGLIIVQNSKKCETWIIILWYVWGWKYNLSLSLWVWMRHLVILRNFFNFRDGQDGITHFLEQKWLITLYVIYGTLTYICLYCRFVLVIWILMWQRRSLSKPLCNLEILCRSKFMRAKDMVMFNLELGFVFYP